MIRSIMNIIILPTNLLKCANNSNINEENKFFDVNVNLFTSNQKINECDSKTQKISFHDFEDILQSVFFEKHEDISEFLSFEEITIEGCREICKKIIYECLNGSYIHENEEKEFQFQIYVNNFCSKNEYFENWMVYILKLHYLKIFKNFSCFLKDSFVSFESQNSIDHNVSLSTAHILYSSIPQKLASSLYYEFKYILSKRHTRMIEKLDSGYEFIHNFTILNLNNSFVFNEAGSKAAVSFNIENYENKPCKIVIDLHFDFGYFYKRVCDLISALELSDFIILLEEIKKETLVLEKKTVENLFVLFNHMDFINQPKIAVKSNFTQILNDITKKLLECDLKDEIKSQFVYNVLSSFFHIYSLHQKRFLNAGKHFSRMIEFKKNTQNLFSSSRIFETYSIEVLREKEIQLKNAIRNFNQMEQKDFLLYMIDLIASFINNFLSDSSSKYKECWNEIISKIVDECDDKDIEDVFFPYYWYSLCFCEILDRCYELKIDKIRINPNINQNRGSDESFSRNNSIDEMMVWDENSFSSVQEQDQIANTFTQNYDSTLSSTQNSSDTITAYDSRIVKTEKKENGVVVLYIYLPENGDGIQILEELEILLPETKNNQKDEKDVFEIEKSID